MIYQLPNGRVINISIDAFLRMSDDELRYLNETNFGSSIENVNPFAITEDTDDASTIVETYIEELPEELDIPNEQEED